MIQYKVKISKIVVKIIEVYLYEMIMSSILLNSQNTSIKQLLLFSVVDNIFETFKGYTILKHCEVFENHTIETFMEK